MARVVPPLIACVPPDDGGVAIGPIGASVRVGTGAFGDEGTSRASPATGGISGGKGSVIGGAGCEGSSMGGMPGASGSVGTSGPGCTCGLVGIPF
ncbi:MAG: hypothetical protein ACK4S7_01470 [Sphingorhabdus sp.]